MRRFKHWAYLNPEGMEVFGDAFPDKTIPVVSMVPQYGPLGNAPPEYYFKVQWDELKKEAREIVLEIMSKKFGATKGEVKRHIAEIGLPLRQSLTNGSGTDHPGFFG